MLMPRKCSDSASAPFIGQKNGALHHRSVSGRVCASHHRIHVTSVGSKASCGSADARCVASGQVIAMARLLYAAAVISPRFSAIATQLRQGAVAVNHSAPGTPPAALPDRPPDGPRHDSSLVDRFDAEAL